MAELMRVPEVAAGATEAVLSEWLVAEGATVAVGDPVAVIETDKAQVEVEAESDAVLIKFLVKDSSQVAIGAPMAVMGTSDEANSDLDQLLATLGVTLDDANAAPSAPVRREVPAAEEESPAPGQDPAPQHVSETVEAADRTPHRNSGSGTSSSAAPASEAKSDSNGRRFASPIARRMLREAGIDLANVVGSGPGGRIVRRDVESAIADPAGSTRKSEPENTADAAAATTAPGSRSSAARSNDYGAQPIERVEHTRLRRAIANRLTGSKQSIPHFYVKRTADIDSLLQLRADLNKRTGRKLSVNDFVVRAVAQAHVDVPDANVIWTDDAMERFDTVDISVAIASERGLVTPVLRSVEQMSLGSISSGVKDLVERANAGKLQQRELEGGTISITNLGMYGVDEFSAIINPPQSAILAVGAGKPQAKVIDDQIEIATVMSLVLSVDHRAIDGALAAQWMGALVEALENPFKLLV